MLQLCVSHRRIILIGQNGVARTGMNRTEPQSYQEFESLPARLRGVVRSPTALFMSVIARPRWAPILLLATAVMAACSAGFALTDVGRQALVDSWEATAIAFGQEVDDARYAQLQALSERGAAFGVLRALLRGPALALGVSIAIVVLFGLAGRRGGRLAQVFAIAAHASVILALRDVIALPLQYARESLANPLSAGLFFPMLDEASPAARFLGMVDLFVLWWAVALAIGVSLMYRLRPRVTAAAFTGAYLGVAVLLAAAMALAGGTRF
jgi:hypothetical protein